MAGGIPCRAGGGPGQRGGAVPKGFAGEFAACSQQSYFPDVAEKEAAKKAEEARIACIKIDENAKKKLAELKKMEEKQGE